MLADVLEEKDSQLICTCGRILVITHDALAETIPVEVLEDDAGRKRYKDFLLGLLEQIEEYEAFA